MLRIAKNYDVAVIGAGHAGYEAALVAARMGARTVLVTIDLSAIGRMSCNPSIGGMAKSHIVFELDSLGGEMAVNTDCTGIQFRVLNTRKGPAVQANRAQCDKAAYSARISEVVVRTRGLQLLEALVSGIWVEAGKLRGIELADGSRLPSTTVIIAAGTFMGGTIYIGKKAFPGGRIGEKPAPELSQSLKNLGFRLGRLKTGTPPRIHRDSIDFAKMQHQPGLYPPPFFSRTIRQEYDLFHVEHRTGGGLKSEISGQRAAGVFHVEQGGVLRPWEPGTDQMPCHLTHTTAETQRIVLDNLGESALYGGMISGTGVRYCPSIEDKMVKFPHHPSHHVFIEPEGRESAEIYPNGTSNSLPEAIQVLMIRSIPGLERSVFTRPGYAIEYDFSDPTQLTASLESKAFPGLFFAGQVNGTTGYEEAAGQGLIAGVNAVLRCRGEPPFVLSRNEAYIGVLIDDLVTKGTDEPYRMFTSRAEHRLLLRQDNASFRMLAHARRLGILSKDRLDEVASILQSVEDEMARLKKTFSDGASLFQILSRPEMTYERLPGRRPDLQREVAEQVEIATRYEGYIRRELDQIARANRVEAQAIPDWVNYNEIQTLRFESREKLKRVRPENLGQASRISGVTPADISILSMWIARGRMFV
jgi:tRNA uridine 5-carboxymethylaminomethyl modification enzyme